MRRNRAMPGLSCLVLLCSSGLVPSQWLRAQEVESQNPVDVEGHAYRTVLIRDRIWFAENLRTCKDPSGRPIESFLYQNDPSQLAENGRLYTYHYGVNAHGTLDRYAASKGALIHVRCVRDG